MLFQVKTGTFGGLIAPLEDRARFEAPLTVEPGADSGDAGGGSQPPAEEGVDGDGVEAQGEAAPEPEREEALEDLIVDADETDDDRVRPHDERIKALAKKNQKLRRQLTKRITAERERDEARGRLATFEANAARDPRLRRILYNEAEPEPQPQRRPDPQDADFDEAGLPFDPNETPINRYFANLAKDNHELRRDLRQLSGRIEGIDGRELSRRDQAIQQEWAGTTEASAEHIPAEGVHVSAESLKVILSDLIKSAYHIAGKGGKARAQQVRDHYYGLLKLSPQAARAAAARPTAPAPNRAASQQRIAENNRSLSRNVAPNGNPAPARASRELLADVNRRLMGQTTRRPGRF